MRLEVYKRHVDLDEYYVVVFPGEWPTWKYPMKRVVSENLATNFSFNFLPEEAVKVDNEKVPVTVLLAVLEEAADALADLLPAALEAKLKAGKPLGATEPPEDYFSEPLGVDAEYYSEAADLPEDNGDWRGVLTL